MGFRVVGKVPAVRLKPVPLTVAEFTVSGEVPEEVRVTEPVVAVLTAMLPKLSVEGLTVSWGLAVVVCAENTTSTQKFVDRKVEVLGKAPDVVWR